MGDVNIDNTKLEEIISRDITPEMQREFFKTLKESSLYLPVDFDSEDADDASGGFSIHFLIDDDENNLLPLFTSPEMMEKAQIYTSAIIMHTQDIANFTKDKYPVISINPFTEYNINMPTEAFLQLFEDKSDDLTVIVPTASNDDHQNFVSLSDGENKSFIPVFSSIDEFKKIFKDGNAYPQVFNIKDVINISKENLILNPASESLIIDREEFEK